MTWNEAVLVARWVLVVGPLVACAIVYITVRP